MALPLRRGVFYLVLILTAVVEAASTPPGIANNPSHARCLIKKYKHCYNLEHVCPKFCPDSCTVECVSCKPICGSSSAPPPLDSADSPPPSSAGGDDDGKGKGDNKGKGDDHNSLPPTPTTPSSAPSSPPNSPSSPTPPENSPVLSPSTPTTPSITSPPPPSQPTPAPSPSTTPTTTTPPPPISTPSSAPPPQSASYPTPSPPTSTPWENTSPPYSSPPYPTPSRPPPRAPPSPPSPPSPPMSENDHYHYVGAARKRCRNKKYPQCNLVEHVCPNSCPYTCQIDCVTCKPVCTCDMPGAVCQDPRFIGGDGITFYFHGKKDQDFCLVTEPNLHINAHFIGLRNENMKRDFTWVQSVGILFGDHQLFIAAKKTTTWDDAVDRLSIAFDGKLISLPTSEGSTWQPTATDLSSAAIVKRDSDTNSVVIQVDGLFKISAKVVPITEHESRVHNYGITKDNCFAHLELGFKFFSLSANVNGVLGQTYSDNYVSRVKIGVPMPILGGEKQFAVSSLFDTDCSVSQFQWGKSGPANDHVAGLELPSMKCGSGIDGRGVVCKR